MLELKCLLSHVAVMCISLVQIDVPCRFEYHECETDSRLHAHYIVFFLVFLTAFALLK